MRRAAVPLDTMVIFCLPQEAGKQLQFFFEKKVMN